ncbi:MAG: O-antigen ligase family protein [Trueperaceae bacterium]
MIGQAQLAPAITERRPAKRDALVEATVVLFVFATFVVSSLPGLSRSVHLAVGLMVLALLARSSRTPLVLRWDSMIPIAWAFTAYAFASVLWSVDHGSALVSAIGLVVDVLGATIVWVALQNGARLRVLATSAAIGASVQGTVALVQTYVLGEARSVGLVGNANALAIQLSMTAFLLLLVLGRQRWAQIVALALFVVATITSGSRKMLFVWLTYVLLLLEQLRFRLKRSSLTTAALLMFLPFLAWGVVEYGGVVIEPLGELTFYQRLEGTFEGRETGKRSGMIVEALRLWWERPVAGYGIDQFRFANRLYGTYSHNNYTEMLANFGVIGLLAFYLLYAVLAVRALRALIDGRRVAWVVLAIIFVTLLMDVARVSYGGRLTWMLLLVMGYVLTTRGEENDAAAAGAEPPERDRDHAEP